MVSGKVYKGTFWRRLQMLEVRLTFSPFLWEFSCYGYPIMGFAYFKLGPVAVDLDW